MIYLWLIFIIGGFLLGSIMFSRIIPKKFAGTDVCEVGDDQNPGAVNVFIHCGPIWGSICLALDMLKGFVPVFLATFFLDTGNMLFSFVLLAPVLGHAIGIFNRLHGGKCISTSFGVLIGILPVTFIGFLLAGLYIIFSVLIRIRSTAARSVVTFALFAIGAVVILTLRDSVSIALGCLFISLTAITKHIVVSLRIRMSDIESNNNGTYERNKT